MIVNTFFDKIYVINLKESIDRKNHIINEFNNMDITNYEFFEAVHFNDNIVTELLNSNKVMSFPPCFRCLKNRCGCENNFLTKYQIANWSSYIKLFNEILASEHNFVLICEDDIVFTKQSKYILNNLLNEANFQKYKINIHMPLLIKMGAAYDNKTHYLHKEPEFIKNYSLSNPCFAVNKEMIKIFLYNLKIIDYHSDIYFHKKIPLNFKNIQMFVMNPFPVYELSFVKSMKKFQSLIRPSNDIRRKEYHDFLFVTVNKLLEYIPLQYSKLLKININNKYIDFNGTVNFYYSLDDLQKSKYYFQNKIFIYDNIQDDIKLISNDIKYNNKSYILNIIYDVILTYNLNIKMNIEDVLHNLEEIYPVILTYFKNNNFIIININDDDNNHNFFNKYNLNQTYMNIKNNIFNNVSSIKPELNEEVHLQH
jgi:GR25 family glycosyltransferase involved in LPS biosynthesis